MTFEKKRKEPRMLSNDRYRPDDKPCEGDCTKCMFGDKCNRKRKTDTAAAAPPPAAGMPGAPGEKRSA
jgi:hypothetical protein